MPTMMPRVPAMTKWCFSLGRGNIPSKWILAGQNVLSKTPWLFEDWDYFALYASVRCLRCEHWRDYFTFWEREHQSLIAGCVLLRDPWSECLSGLRRISPIFGPIQMSKEPAMNNLQWKTTTSFEISFKSFEWGGRIMSIESWGFLFVKKNLSPKILPCCQYIVIFLSFIPGSERMAIYIAPLHCHGECLSSSHRQRDPPQQYTKYTNTKYKYNTVQIKIQNWVESQIQYSRHCECPSSSHRQRDPPQ